MDFACGKRQAVESHASQTTSKPVLLFGSKKRGLPRVIEQLCLSWLALPDLRCVFFASSGACVLVFGYFSIMRELVLTESVAYKHCRSLTTLNLVDHTDSRTLALLRNNAGTLKRLAVYWLEQDDLAVLSGCHFLEHLELQNGGLREDNDVRIGPDFCPSALPPLTSVHLVNYYAHRVLSIGKHE